MSRYDAHKNPMQYRLNAWFNHRVNEHLQRQAKSIPCHVTKVDKDFVEVQFETHDNTITPPTVKIPQSFSPYAREPTQVGDKGYAVPSDYYLGGVSGQAGGGTNYYPRSNLTPLSFQPVSQTQNPTRDYDQYTIVGGPNGVHIVQSGPPQQQDSSSTTTSPPPPPPVAMRQVRLSQAIPGKGFYLSVPKGKVSKGVSITSRGVRVAQQNGTTPPAPSGDTLPPVAAPKQTLDQPDKSTFTIDQNQKFTMDGTNQFKMTIDSKSNKITIEAPVTQKIFVGGDGIKGTYAKIATLGGPMINGFGRIS